MLACSISLDLLSNVFVEMREPFVINSYYFNLKRNAATTIRITKMRVTRAVALTPKISVNLVV